MDTETAKLLKLNRIRRKKKAEVALINTEIWRLRKIIETPKDPTLFANLTLPATYLSKVRRLPAYQQKQLVNILSRSPAEIRRALMQAYNIPRSRLGANDVFYLLQDARRYLRHNSVKKEEIMWVELSKHLS